MNLDVNHLNVIITSLSVAIDAKYCQLELQLCSAIINGLWSSHLADVYPRTFPQLNIKSLGCMNLDETIQM